jgi:hypothetical protein
VVVLPEAVMSLTDVIALAALALGIMNVVVEWHSKRPPSLARQRRERQMRMKDSCEIRPAPAAWTSLADWPVAATVPCYVGFPTERDAQELEVHSHMGFMTMQVALYWPISLPHGTAVRAGDHLVVRSSGSERRFSVVLVYGPYTDELSRDVIGRVVRL